MMVLPYIKRIWYDKIASHIIVSSRFALMFGYLRSRKRARHLHSSRRGVRWIVGIGLAISILMLLVAVRAGKPASAGLVVGHAPNEIVIDEAYHHVFVLNYGDGTLSMITTGGTPTIQTLAVHGMPYPLGSGLAIAQSTAHVFVAFNATLSMLDARTGRVLRVTTLNAPPSTLAVDDRTKRVFVAEANNFQGNSIGVFDASTGLLVRRVTVGKGPGACAIDEQSGQVFVENLGQNTVSVLDAHSGVLLRTLTVGHGSSILGQARTLGGPLPGEMAVDPRTSRVFAARYNAVSVLDERTGRIIRTTAVGRIPIAMVLDAQTGHVFVGNLQENTVSVLDAQSGRLLRTVRVGERPWALAVAVASSRVYVAAANGNTVSVLDADSGRVVRSVPAGIEPVNMAVDESAHRLYIVNMLAYRGPGSVAWAMAREPPWLRLLQLLPFVPRPDGSGTGAIPGSVGILPLRQ